MVFPTFKKTGDTHAYWIFREPKIVNGPEILDKYVGESEANIRKLFQEAEDDEKKLGLN